MLTVSPNRQYCGVRKPTTPATTPPLCRPAHRGKQVTQRVNKQMNYADGQRMNVAMAEQFVYKVNKNIILLQ